MGEHCAEGHDHEGEMCELCLFSKHTDYVEPKAVAIATTFDYVTFRVALPNQATAISAIHNLSLPRAPPHFS